MQMIARKRVKYPHGHAGKEYAPGQPFTALSERDAKSLFIAGKADYDKAATVRNVTDPPAKPPAATKAMTDAAAELPRQRRNTYNRADMQPAPVGEYHRTDLQTQTHGQTGAETSSPSSPPDLPPSEPISGS